MLVQIKGEPNGHKLPPSFQYCYLVILEQQKGHLFSLSIKASLAFIIFKKIK